MHRSHKPTRRPSLEALEERSLLSVTPLSDNPAPFLTTNGYSAAQAVSADGRYVVLETAATDLAAGVTDSNGGQDLYLLDRVAGTKTLISHAAGSPNTAANGASRFATISADGRFVAYETLATDLAGNVQDNNGESDVYVWDRLTNQNQLVSFDGFPKPQGEIRHATNGASYLARISADGSHIAYTSTGNNLVTSPAGFQAEQNDGQDVFLYDVNQGTNALVSIDAADSNHRVTGDGISFGPSISKDGTKVAFISLATHLDGKADDSNGFYDVYLYDDVTKTVKLVSHDSVKPNVAAGVFGFEDVSLSANGRFISYASVPAGTQTVQVFLYDAQADASVQITNGNGSSGTAVVSADGRYVAFSSSATDLVAGQVDVVGTRDVFRYDRLSGETILVSAKAGTKNVAGDGYADDRGLVISGDGRFITYQSKATNLVDGQADTNKAFDVFLFDADAQMTFLVSNVGDGKTAGNGRSSSAVISRDGSFVAFSSEASDLVPFDLNGKQDAFGFDNPNFGTIYVEGYDGGKVPVVKPQKGDQTRRISAIDALMIKLPGRPVSDGLLLPAVQVDNALAERGLIGLLCDAGTMTTAPASPSDGRLDAALIGML